MKVSVIGCGAWGTTSAILLGEYSREDVCLWVRPWEKYGDESLASVVNRYRTNPIYLPGIKIPENIKITDSLEEAVSDAEIVVSAVPSEFLRNSVSGFREYANDRQIIVSLTKGVEYNEGENTFMLMSEVIAQELCIPYANVVALSGPTLAVEIAEGKGGLAVAAGLSEERVTLTKVLFDSSPKFKVYKAEVKDDIRGVELGGALKNPYTISAGICDYLIEKGETGDNLKAALQTRCLKEMVRFAETIGAERSTIYGLAGMGDLNLCFSSRKSRNHQFGYLIAQGYSPEQAQQKIKGVVEGIRTAKAVHEYAESSGQDLNIMRQIYLIIYKQKPIPDAINDLMTRGTEVE